METNGVGVSKRKHPARGGAIGGQVAGGGGGLSGSEAASGPTPPAPTYWVTAGPSLCGGGLARHVSTDRCVRAAAKFFSASHGADRSNCAKTLVVSWRFWSRRGSRGTI